MSTLILSVSLLMTNRWLGHDDGIRLMAAADTRSSMSIALAAPSLPQAPVPYHHAQRIAVSYVVGLAAKATRVSPHVWFTLTTLLCFAAVVAVYHRILAHLRISETAHFVLVSLLILNPYSFRYYFAVPGLAYDLVFVLGLSVVVLGLLKGDFLTVLVGLLVACLGRQTGLLMLPAMGLWIVWGSPWKQRSVHFRAICVASLGGCALIVYIATASVASQFAGPSVNVEHLTRIFHSSGGTLGMGGFAELAARATVPMVFPTAILLGILASTRQRRALALEFWACLTFSLCIATQPILGGGTNVTRLTALGLVPWLIGLGMVLQETRGLERPHPTIPALLQSLIVFGSFHHMYTFIGGDMSQASRFWVIHSGLAAVAGYLAYRASCFSPEARGQTNT